MPSGNRRVKSRLIPLVDLWVCIKNQRKQSGESIFLTSVISGPPEEDTFLNREVSQLRRDQLAPATQINSCSAAYTSAFKQSNYTRRIYKPFVQYKWLLHMQLLWFIKLKAFHHRQNLWDWQIHGHENAVRVNTCCSVGSLNSPDTSSTLRGHC